MSDSVPPSPDHDPAARELRARQKSTVYFAITLLVLCAVALLSLPLHKVPFPFRALAAAGDLVIAAVLWLVVRQKLDGK
jgi:Na+/H+ antiporter NhaD/arsenite permease-like protein